jgi:hypothetical protein
MANMNKVILAGNLTAIRSFRTCRATRRSGAGYGDQQEVEAQNGDMKDDTCFVDLRVAVRRDALNHAEG